MKPIEIMEALTDLEDDVLLHAESDPPRRRRVFFHWRKAAAACLVLAVCLSALMAFDAEAGDAKLHWTVDFREDCFVYRFSTRQRPDIPLPEYRLTWIPEGYRFFFDHESEHDYMVVYHRSEEDPDSIWFDYNLVGAGDSIRFEYEEGSYTVETVWIQGIQADYYHIPEYDMGYFVWIDRDQSLVFQLNFHCDVETALRVAESIQLMEGE